MFIAIDLKKEDLQKVEGIFYDWFLKLQEEREEAREQGYSTDLIPSMTKEYVESENVLVYTYVTCSNKGTWKLVIDNKVKHGFISFTGYRNSFLGGNLFLEVYNVPLYPESGNKATIAIIDVDGNEHVFEGVISDYQTSRPEKPLGFSKKLSAAIRRFSQEHPRLFVANSKFFRYVLEHDQEIEQHLAKWFSEHGKSEVFIIATHNKLSKWTELIVKVYRNHQKSYSSEPISIFKAYRYTKNYLDEQVYFIDQDKIKIENETTILIL